MQKVYSGLLLSAVLVSGVMGCSNSSERPTVGTLHEGLNMLDVTDPTWGTNTAYLKDGRVIYIETRMGALKPEVFRLTAPDQPANEIDLRFIDQNGISFFVQRGGDTYVDPTWAADIQARSQEALAVDPAERNLDWALAQEAGLAFAAQAPAAFRDHTHDIQEFASRPSVPNDPELRRALVEVAKDHPIPAEEAAKGSYTASGWMQTYTALYSGRVCSAWICVADHSATIMYVNPNVGYWIQAISANNHGRAWNGSGMGYRCYSGASAWQYGTTINGSTAGGATGGSDGQGGCQTPYSWNSGGYDHLCNSDAAYELWQGKEATQNTSRGGNISFTWDGPGNYACNCNNNNDCDGDWTRPNCP